MKKLQKILTVIGVLLTSGFYILVVVYPFLYPDSPNSIEQLLILNVALSLTILLKEPIKNHLYNE